MLWQRRGTSSLLIFALACLLLANFLPAAEVHAVKLSELHQAIQDASRAREKNLESVCGFFAAEPAAQAMKKAQMDPVKIGQAASLLDDQELARLASQTAKIQQDFTVGALNNQQLTYIIIALATAVIVILLIGR
jgi:hypothetical protein